MNHPSPKASIEGVRLTFITTGENSDFAATFCKAACKFFYDGGFAGTAYGEVTYGYDETAEGSGFKDTVFKEEETELDNESKDVGEDFEDRGAEFMEFSFTSIINNIDNELL